MTGADGEVLFSHPVRVGESFSISFIHSVNLSPVEEIFEVRRAGELALTALEFETFGAGMPTELEPGQTMKRLPDGKMRVDGFNRILSEMHILVTSHTLHLGSHSVPLYSLTSEGQRISLRVLRSLY